MPSTKTNSAESIASAEGAFVANRIDAAHVLNDSPSKEELAPRTQSPRFDQGNTGSELDELTRLAALETAPTDPLRLQASQLAEFLRARQFDLDQREATLNATIAQLEKERRAHRLQVREFEDSKSQVEHEWQIRSQEFDQRLAVITASELAVQVDESATEKLLAELSRRTDERQIDLDLQAAELTRRQKEIEQSQREWTRERITATEQLLREREQLAAERHVQESEFAELLGQLDRNRLAWEQEKQLQLQQLSDQRIQDLERSWTELRESQRNLRTKASHLETLEHLLKESWQAVERERRELESRSAAAESQLREQQQLLSEERRKHEEATRLQAAQLQQREDTLARQNAGIERTRADLMRVHHETLEMRLALEQLWNQLGDRVGAAELTRAVATTRTQLSEEYRLANQALTEQQREVKELTRRMIEYQSQLRRQRTELQEWLERRNQELHEHELRLATREEQISSPERQIAELRSQLEKQQRDSQRQIQQLAVQIGLKLRAELRAP